jgi:hypothetical protein
MHMARWLFLVTVALAVPLGGLSAQEVVERTVKANSRTAVGILLSHWEGTCEQAAIPDAKLGAMPKNGRAEIEMHRITLSKPHMCEGRQWSGPAIFYTPAKGFKGSDRFVVEFPFASNEVSAPVMRSTTYSITVE